MNIYHKYIFIAYITIIYSGFIYSATKSISNTTYPIQQCNEAKYGVLNINIGNYTDPQINSYLLDCAVTATISTLSTISGKSKSKAIRKSEKEKK
jgi:hypothetical protein